MFMEEIKITNELRSKRLTGSDKDRLYDILKHVSQEKKKKEELIKSLGYYLEDTIYNDVMDPEMKRLMVGNRIYSSTKCIKLSLADFGLADDKNDNYPNDKLPNSKFDPTKMRKTSGWFYIPAEKIPEEYSEFLDWKDLIVDKSRLLVIKELLVQLCEASLDLDNFLYEKFYNFYSWNKVFLPEINTWGKLFDQYKEWFKLLLEDRKDTYILNKEDLEEGYVLDRLKGLKHTLRI